MGMSRARYVAIFAMAALVMTLAPPVAAATASTASRTVMTVASAPRAPSAGAMASAMVRPWAAKPLKSGKPTISGTAAVGQKLTARPGSWTPGTTFSYQWYAGGKKIAGATKATYLLKSAQAGSTMTVKVTGKKSGYRTTTVTSRATAVVQKAGGGAKAYQNCTEMHRDYPHGVGKKGAVDSTAAGVKATRFYVSNSLYAANQKSDRDKDGVACEA